MIRDNPDNLSVKRKSKYSQPTFQDSQLKFNSKLYSRLPLCPVFSLYPINTRLTKGINANVVALFYFTQYTY